MNGGASDQVIPTPGDTREEALHADESIAASTTQDHRNTRIRRLRRMSRNLIFRTNCAIWTFAFVFIFFLLTFDASIWVLLGITIVMFIAFMVKLQYTLRRTLAQTTRDRSNRFSLISIDPLRLGLTAVERDFDENDYEMLLALDFDNPTPTRLQGATKREISTLPTHLVTSADSVNLKDKPCQICLDSYVEGEKLRTLACAHIFHAKCIDKWLKIKNQCPVCKVNALHGEVIV